MYLYTLNTYPILPHTIKQITLLATVQRGNKEKGIYSH